MTRRWRAVFIAVWIVVATTLTVVGAVDLAHQIRLQSRPSATGVVVDWTRTGFRTNTSCRTIDFRPRGSTQTVRFTESLCRIEPGRLGTAVTVRYDPRHPADAVVAGDAEWVAPAAFAAGGVAMLALGWWAWRRYDSAASGTYRTRG